MDNYHQEWFCYKAFTHYKKTTFTIHKVDKYGKVNVLPHTTEIYEDEAEVRQACFILNDRWEK